MRFFTCLTHVCLYSSLFCLTGCGAKEELLPLAKVTGQVKMDNVPLTRGTIIFIPDGSRGTRGRMAVGQIDEDGNYELTTYSPQDGAMVGFHKVVIQSYEEPNYEKYSKAGEPPPPSKSLIPEEYADESRNRLTAEVKRDQSEPISFNLFSKP